MIASGYSRKYSHYWIYSTREIAQANDKRLSSDLWGCEEDQELFVSPENHNLETFIRKKIQKLILFLGPRVDLPLKGSFSCKRGFSLLNFERGLKKNYGLPNLETLCSYYSLLETTTVLILCKNIESFLRYDCSKWDMLFSQR